ncbi:hypothetical protein [Gorillibacterium timonense]|uniref:hypothetical protein n=1 Tax=Gorillibacterium timonense TaxID=1689269 RepID=UPI00071DD69A|nr:hypothetical protein [Gorillibacterium timonense]
MKDERIELDISRIMMQLGIRSQDVERANAYPSFNRDSGARSEGLRPVRTKPLPYSKFSAKFFGSRNR